MYVDGVPPRACSSVRSFVRSFLDCQGLFEVANVVKIIRIPPQPLLLFTASPLTFPRPSALSAPSNTTYFQNDFDTIFPAVCLSYAGRGGWSEKFESELESEPPARTGRMMRTPAFPEDFAARFDFSSRDKFAGNSIIRDDPNPQHEVSAANGERRESRLSSRGTSSDFVGRPSISLEVASPETITAPRLNVCGVIRVVFGGAFFSSSVPRIQGCPKKFDCGKQLDGCSAAAFASATDVGEGGGGGPGAPAVTVALAMNSAVKPPSPPSERYYVAYGHCLLAGAGTGARDEATEAAATAVGQCDGILGPSKIGDFGSVSSRARTSARRRTRGYGDALEIFQEGLRRFPTSTALLYGASLAMQVRMYMYLENKREAETSPENCFRCSRAVFSFPWYAVVPYPAVEFRNSPT